MQQQRHDEQKTALRISASTSASSASYSTSLVLQPSTSNANYGGGSTNSISSAISAEKSRRRRRRRRRSSGSSRRSSGSFTSGNTAVGGSNDMQFANLAGEAAEKRIEELERNSKLQMKPNNIPVPISWDDVNVEDLLGVGGFACVCLTRIRKLSTTLNRQAAAAKCLSLSSPGGGGTPTACPPAVDDCGSHNNDNQGDAIETAKNGEQGNDGKNSYSKAKKGVKVVGDEDDSICSLELSSTSFDYEDEKDEDIGDLVDPSSPDYAPADKYYALKCLNRRTMASKKHFIGGAADLAGEAFLLSRLCHDNIIRFYGAAEGGVSAAFQKPGGYFLVLEALEGTLHGLLNKWRSIEPPKSGSSARHLFKSSSRRNLVDNGVDVSRIPSVQDRLKRIAIGIARGVQYLHHNKVLFRDLKPHNVGLDWDGNVRLFDFGLAREVDTVQRNAMPKPQTVPLAESGELSNVNGAEFEKPANAHGSASNGSELLLVKGVAGSLRYMAPETMLHSFCSSASDVYGFGVLLWELCTLVKPFEKITASAREYKKAVAGNGLRPNVRILGMGSNVHVNMKVIKALMESCWATDWTIRPNFDIIIEVLEKVVGVDGTSDGAERQLQLQFQTENSSRSLFAGIGRSKRSSPNLVLKSALSSDSLSNWNLSTYSTESNATWNTAIGNNIMSGRGSSGALSSMASFTRGMKRSGNSSSSLLPSRGMPGSMGQANATWSASPCNQDASKRGFLLGNNMRVRKSSNALSRMKSMTRMKSSLSTTSASSSRLHSRMTPSDNHSSGGEANAAWIGDGLFVGRMNRHGQALNQTTGSRTGGSQNAAWRNMNVSMQGAANGLSGGALNRQGLNRSTGDSVSGKDSVGLSPKSTPRGKHLASILGM